MSGVVYQVPAMQRVQIRDVAKNIRRINKEMTGQDAPFFPIVQFLDVTLTKHMEDFILEILDEDEMGDAHGMTYPDEHLIQVRSDVYKQACRHQGRDRMTLAHELGHYVLHSNIGMARMAPVELIKPWRSSEWQAKALAGELLIPVEHIYDCASPFEAALKFGVTVEAAIYQWGIFRKEGLIR
ncbi:MAG: ImmA/IrrE family metallo-endopeptidase [Methylobacter sp.]|jgi:Zn-dependent peptidase ImmA (M78 family)|uniref:ImmA/IrrE family metallo-endopeptidase n=1 Tax=Methylobacter sp. TaxID=2051955 RepID=UPI0025FAA7E7|nr:ImmA/IrrE family metallo-endopeptidase [Methylobacter sp.]MCK9622901.1 ImmA/IrrE family metallo-endopeptidase [Methylobacter sp.]